MTIYNDNAGNKFLGDCIYANHNVSYSSVNFLQAHPHSSISAELTALLSASGLQYRNVMPQSLFDDWSWAGTPKTMVAFAPQSDSINDRYTFGLYGWGTGGAQTGTGVDIGLYNNFGYTPVDNSVSTTNRFFTYVHFPGWIASSGFFYIAEINLVGSGYGWGLVSPIDVNASLYSPISWSAVADSESLALFITQKRFGNNYISSIFYYVGTVSDVNSGSNYYSADIQFKTIALIARSSTNLNPELLPPCAGAHYISNTGKELLQTGDAQYPIACSDGQNPTSHWATDFYVFDNNDSFGYPAIGRVRNLLLAQGDYTIGKPVKISGTVQPDNGFNAWLPVGTFAGKTVLMRCYSSASL